MVYVDELVPSIKAVGRFKAGTLWCHLTADRIEELHDFAKSLGLIKSWFQDSSTHPHYDLVASRRTLALTNGAQFMPAKQQAIMRLNRLSNTVDPFESDEAP